MSDSQATKSFRALLIAIFVSSIPATLILPMTPSLGKLFSVGAVELGLLVGIYPLMSMIASPFWGRMSDRFGRKPILLVSLLGGAFAFAVFALSASYMALFAARALQGLAGTPRGIGFAVASDVSDGKNRTAKMGAVTASMAIAFTIGPILGGFFMGEDPDSWLGSMRVAMGLPGDGFNHVIPALLGMTANLVGALIVALSFKESWNPANRAAKDKAAESASSTTSSFSTAIFQSSVILAIIFFLLSGYLQNSLQFSFILWADIKLGWNAQYIAWSGALLGLGFAVGAGLLLKPMTRTFGQEKTVLIGTLIDATGLSIFLLAQEIPAIALAGLFFGATGNSLWATTILSLLSREIDERDQGLAMGVANGASLLGRVLGPAFAGYLAANFSANTPFIAIAFCVGLAIIRGITLVYRKRSSPE